MQALITRVNRLTVLSLTLLLFVLACSDTTAVRDGVTRIVIEPATLGLRSTEDTTLAAKAFDVRGEEVQAPITWSSSDTLIARITPAGELLALKPGAVTLEARSGAVSATLYTQIRPFDQYDLVFERIVEDRVELWVRDLNGGTERRLLPGVAAAEPAPSPDGTRIAFVSYRNAGARADIFVVNRDGSGLRRLTNAGEIAQHPAWSPDGNRIAFRVEESGDSDIWVMSVDGTGLQNLTDDLLPVISHERFPSWSPDGYRIAFTRTLGPASDVWVMNADGSNKTQLSATSADETRPVWSPNGGYLAFGQRIPGAAGDIAIVSKNGHDVLRVELPGEQDLPAWSPDGRLVAFASNHEGARAIYVLHFNSPHILRGSVGGAGDSHPAWLKR